MMVSCDFHHCKKIWWKKTAWLCLMDAWGIFVVVVLQASETPFFIMVSIMFLKCQDGC